MVWNRGDKRRRGSRAVCASALAFLLVAPAAHAAGTPVPAATPRRGTPSAGPVTDANVAQRVLNARTKADNLALADYYMHKAAAEQSRIDFYDQLFRAYMKLEGKKQVEPLQRHARALLRAARVSKARYELLAQAHRDIAWED